MGYYLADGIAQESARNDVERAFGVLQSRFALVKGPTRFFYQGDIADIMYACIIMHNMIIDDEYDGYALSATIRSVVASVEIRWFSNRSHQNPLGCKECLPYNQYENGSRHAHGHTIV
ncbi:uncharacterized protein LOC125198588 [Salvia hispanica]|uniref:uncharacterized protein LOC125198588 n=1 Tax=Salvia hispanica TaxID=49212 RepID=UPI002008FEC3|nr:uncharacterized protein LOC125198588 [Salvia hispanica]